MLWECLKHMIRGSSRQPHESAKIVFLSFNIFCSATIKYNRYAKNTFFDWYLCQVFRQDGWRWWHVSSCKLFMTFFPCTKIRGVSSFMYYYFYYTLQSRIHLLLHLVFWEPRYRNACKMEHFEFGHNSQNIDLPRIFWNLINVHFSVLFKILNSFLLHKSRHKLKQKW